MSRIFHRTGGQGQGVSFSGEGEQGTWSDVWCAGELLPGPSGQSASGLHEERARGRAGEQRPAQVQQPRGQIWRPSDGIRPGAQWVISSAIIMRITSCIRPQHLLEDSSWTRSLMSRHCRVRDPLWEGTRTFWQRYQRWTQPLQIKNRWGNFKNH